MDSEGKCMNGGWIDWVAGWRDGKSSLENNMARSRFLVRRVCDRQ